LLGTTFALSNVQYLTEKKNDGTHCGYLLNRPRLIWGNVFHLEEPSSIRVPG
jgi:hypothetical protein